MCRGNSHLLLKYLFGIWFKLYFICIIYDKYTNNTEYDYNTTTIQMVFRKSQMTYLNLYPKSSHNLYMYYHVVIVIYVENNGRTL